MTSGRSTPNRRTRIVRAAEALIAHWKSMGGPGGWQHRGHWFPISSEKFAVALINAVRSKEKRRARSPQ